MKRQTLFAMLALIVSACSNAPIQPPGNSHLSTEKVGTGRTAAIPAPVQQTLALPKPKPAAKVETYSVVVNNVRVQELLFALARDAKLNVDIHPGIEGAVTLNAIDQTLQQLLTRIAKQVDVRWELDGPNLAVMPDKPFLRTYKIDFVNMARTVKNSVSTSTQISSAVAAGGRTTPSGNMASTEITSDTKNDLMESLIKNVTDMLLEEDKLRYRAQIDADVEVRARTSGDGKISAGMTSGGTTSAAAAASAGNSAAVAATKSTNGPGGFVAGSGNQEAENRSAAKERFGEYQQAVHVFANKETGVLIVRATSRQHEKVLQFIDQVMSAAKRQVLLEATIVEVNLTADHSQGIDWKKVTAGLVALNPTGLAAVGGNILMQGTTGLLTMQHSSGGNTFQATLKLLSEYGNLKVLSSPKISVMNNQTATLKVADNKVFFTMDATTTQGQTSTVTTYTTKPNSVTVGFIMNVTPQISDNDQVTINVRPTITRINGYVKDPNPSLAAAGVENLVPEIQTREMESIIRVNSGQIAVMGGLMQEEMNNNLDTAPGLVNIPVFGNLFKNSANKSSKTELVIFLRPVVIEDASIEGDYANFRSSLPGTDFFGKDYAGPRPQQLDLGGAQ